MKRGWMDGWKVLSNLIKIAWRSESRMLGRTCHNRFVTIYSDCFFPIFSFFFDYHLLSFSLALCTTKTHTEQNMLVVHDIFFCSCGLVVCVCVWMWVYIYIIPITAIYRSCAMSESFFFWLKHFDQISFFPKTLSAAGTFVRS